MMRNNILFTGPSGCGKTTLMRRIVKELQTPSAGFFTQEIREKEKRVGFTINTLDGKEALLAHINISGQDRAGRYGVVLESINIIAVPSMIPKTPKESVVIDEIGKMECFSSLFKETVLDVLDVPNTVVGTISLRGDQFIKEIKDRSDVLVVEISEKNRNDLPNTFNNLLKKQGEREYPFLKAWLPSKYPPFFRKNVFSKMSTSIFVSDDSLVS